MISTLFHYYWYRLRAPHLKDYLSMGLGIEARYKRCKKYWDPHLNATKIFIERSIELISPSSVTILGSGRLFDVPSDVFHRRDITVECIDADPLSIAIGRRKETTWNFKQHDVTGTIEDWTNRLRNFIGSGAVTSLDLSEYLLSLTPLTPSLDQADCVISLNLLGQIPVYWRDRFEALLQGAGLVSAEHGLESVLERALDESCARLQEHHLSQIKSASKLGFVIIFDRAFHYYQKDRSDWRSYSALYVPVSKEFSDLHKSFSDSWFWHIAPQGIEQEEYGAIHEIEAVCYRR